MDPNHGLLEKAFSVYTIAIILLLIYIICDNHWERASLEDDIDAMELKIKKLAQNLGNSPYRYTETEKNIDLLIVDRKRCKMKISSLKMGRKLMSKKMDDPLSVWSKISRPFIHLQLHASEAQFTREETEDSTHYQISGWSKSHLHQQGCSNVDPKLQRNNTTIEITVSGNYFVYSRAPVLCNKGLKSTSIHQHIVEMKNQSNPKFSSLMINSFQLCGENKEDSDSSYQAGIFDLRKGFLLQVSLSYTEHNQRYNWMSDVEEIMEFGVFLL